jgi:hypothetical protein
VEGTPAAAPARRQKAQSMGPRLKILSPTKKAGTRYSIVDNKQSVIEEEGDLQYTDGEHSTE